MVFKNGNRKIITTGSVTAPFLKTKQMTIEDKFKIIDIEATLKMLLVHSELLEYQKEWVVKSYKHILELKQQNDI